MRFKVVASSSSLCGNNKFRGNVRKSRDDKLINEQFVNLMLSGISTHRAVLNKQACQLRC